MLPVRTIFARSFSEPNKLNGSKYGNGSRAEGLLKIRVYLRAPIIVYGSAQAPPKERFGSLLSKMIIFNPKNGENFEKNAKKEAPQGGFDTKTQSKLHKICLFRRFLKELPNPTRSDIDAQARFFDSTWGIARDVLLDIGIIGIASWHDWRGKKKNVLWV